jgi:hypothetical protein
MCESFSRKGGWKVKWVFARKNYFERDIVAEKGNQEYIIQANGDRLPQKAFLIQYAIGEIVAEMRESSPEIHYGIALPESIARKLWKFGEEGLKALNLHWFIVTDYGLVYHLNLEEIIQYMANLRLQGEDQVSPSPLSTPP